jgi:hypothetical protein
MTKTFYITYWANKHKKHITRQGKHDDKSRYGVSKKGSLILFMIAMCLWQMVKKS